MTDPAIDLDLFVGIQRQAFADDALSRHRIYLDTNYWIHLRDAAFRQPRQPVFTELWRRLRALAQLGRVICPPSEPFFWEVLKQNRQPRRRMACVVDRLCGGVCISDRHARIIAEVRHFVRPHSLGGATSSPPKRLVWAPVSHVFGMGHQSFSNYSPEWNLAQQKLWYHHAEFLRFSDLIEQVGAEPSPWPPTTLFNLMLNFWSDLTRDQLESLQATYRVEVGNMTDIIAEELAGLAANLFDEGVRTPLGPEKSATELAASLASFITTGLTLKRITTQLPQYHIMGAVHASNRWSRRRHRDNDLHDHQHAAAALPYCHAFFTERGLREALQQGPFRLDRAYGCRVISDPAEAVEYVGQLARDRDRPDPPRPA